MSDHTRLAYVRILSVSTSYSDLKSMVEEAAVHGVSQYLNDKGSNDAVPSPKDFEVSESHNEGGTTLFLVFLGAVAAGAGKELGKRVVAAVWEHMARYLADKYGSKVAIETIDRNETPVT